MSGGDGPYSEEPLPIRGRESGRGRWPPGWLHGHMDTKYFADGSRNHGAEGLSACGL